MANQTPNLKLDKPADNESADISVLNANMDKIDTAVNDKLSKNMATAADLIIVSSGIGAWVTKTLEQFKTWLGLGSAAFTDSKDYATASQGIKADNAATKADFDAHSSDLSAHSIDTRLPINGGTIEAYTEKEVANAAAAGTVTLDLSAQNVFEITLADNVIIELSNVPAAGKACSFSIVIHQGATAKTVTFPAPFKWMGGSIPDLSAVSKTHIIFGTTVDGGVTIYANAATNF